MNVSKNTMRAAVMAGLSLFLVNCASKDVAYRPAPATYFMVQVKSGETLSDIAYRYNVRQEDIVAINDIYDRDQVRAGKQLRVPAYGWADRRNRTSSSPSQRTVSRPAPRPETQRVAVVKPVPRPNRDEIAPRETPVRRDSSTTFLWPVHGPLLSSYGKSVGGERNDGINISTAAGTQIRAAASGTVTYVGNELKGYGNLLLIKHDNGYVTAYAHAERINVARGDRVTRGQVVGYAGATGDVTQPQLHFEIRQGTRPVDPKPYLVASN